MRPYILTFLCCSSLLGLPVRAQINPAILRRAVYQAARVNPAIPKDLFHSISYSLIQLHRPGEKGIIGSGFLLNYQHKLFAVLPHHIAGNTGRTWEIEITSLNHQTYRFPITIPKHGEFNDQTPDISLTDLTNYNLPALQALELAKPALNLPAYSFGYTIGSYQPDEFLPLERHFLQAQGWEMTTDRILPAEIPSQPVDLAGYCGSPLLQYQQGIWKVVGMHIGSCIYGENKSSLNRAFAVNLPKALALLQKQDIPNFHAKPLQWNGILIDYIQPNEYIRDIEIERNGISVCWMPGTTDIDPVHLETILQQQFKTRTYDRLILNITDNTTQRVVKLSLP